VEAHVAELTERMVDSYRREIPTYAALEDPDVLEAVRATSRLNVLVLVEVLTRGEPATPELVAAMRELGAERARQGFSPDTVIQACQVGSRVVWDFAVERLEDLRLDEHVATALITELGGLLMQFTAAITGAVAAGMSATSTDRGAERERIAGSLFEELLSGTVRDRRYLAERAAFVEFGLGACHAVVLLAVVPRPGHPGLLPPVLQRRAREALAAAVPPGRQPIVRPRGQAVAAILPLAEEAPVPAVAARLRTALVQALGPEEGYVAVVGGIEPGIEGIAASYRQARRGLEGLRAVGGTGVHDFLALVPQLLLQAEPVLAQDLHAATLGRLVVDADGRGEQLVETLRTMFDERWSMQSAARRLHMHRHTLTTRLQRIEDLTGLSLHDSDHRLLLQLALRHGAPGQPGL
jgi:sugar diacid utilization regulator